MEANQLRAAFTDFFVAKGHVLVPSASLIPHDPTVLFTVAGMVPFKPYFLGEERPPYQRATSVQKCMRAGGKHNDLDQIGRTMRHLTFFEMLGNFSFGDYFKNDAISFAWELITEVLQIDAQRLWITVHISDDEAAEIWHKKVGVPKSRIQRLDEDNWWQMADTGPCGPCSEIYYDKGPEYGDGGGPAVGSDERFLEIWNLVFMQFDRSEDGELKPLPKQCIDTGAGLERILPILQGKASVYETDLLWPILQMAAKVTGVTYGQNYDIDVSLRIMADHARSMVFLVADGVLPSNEGRGYVLRRIIRRAALRAWRISSSAKLDALLETVFSTMGVAYPQIIQSQDFIQSVIAREEERFARTLGAGAKTLDQELSSGLVISGAAAFRLHDTFGFPIELTQEIANERGIDVDVAGFDQEMMAQRTRARADFKGKVDEAGLIEQYRNLLDLFGPTHFSGYVTTTDTGRVIAIQESASSPGQLEIFTDRTCFYAEQGGQVGDTGTISGDNARGLIVGTDFAMHGLIRHYVKPIEGQFSVGQQIQLDVDEDRRAKIKRNHTATHLAHWALREVLGTHVKQQGSLVAPDRLRFDFFHWNAVANEELRKVESMVNSAILDNQIVHTEETSKESALAMGAVAFFGDKYGDSVRVVKAGLNSLEFCGGTHVDQLGTIGTFVIVSETSVGANTRRIEALTGEAALGYFQSRSDLVSQLVRELGTGENEVIKKVESLKLKERELAQKLKSMESERLNDVARELVALAKNDQLVIRRDGFSGSALKELASNIRSFGVSLVVLFSKDGEGRAGVVAMRSPECAINVSSLISGSARLLGGGVGKSPDFAQSGGKNVGEIDSALSLVIETLGQV